MIPDTLLTRSDMVSFTGMTHDVLTFWLRRGVLQPHTPRNGRGRHLRFYYYEANIAAVLLQARSLGANIEALDGISKIYREAISWAEKLGIHADVDEEFLSEVRAWDAYPSNPEKHKIFLDEYIGHADKRFGLDERRLSILHRLNKREVLDLQWRFDDIMRIPRKMIDPDLTFFWQSGSVWKAAWGEYGTLEARADGILATMAIDVRAAIYNVWNLNPGDVHNVRSTNSADSGTVEARA